MRKFALVLLACCRRIVFVGVRLQHHADDQDEQIKSAWSEVLNQYQRRADLIPNLVKTVKGYAAQEQTVLLGVTQARAKVGLDPGDSRAGQRSRRRWRSSKRPSRN